MYVWDGPYTDRPTGHDVPPVSGAATGLDDEPPASPDGRRDTPITKLNVPYRWGNTQQTIECTVQLEGHRPRALGTHTKKLIAYWCTAFGMRHQPSIICAVHTGERAVGGADSTSRANHIAGSAPDWHNKRTGPDRVARSVRLHPTVQAATRPPTPGLSTRLRARGALAGAQTECPVGCPVQRGVPQTPPRHPLHR